MSERQVERLLVDASLAALRDVLRRKEVSPVELARASLARLERLGPTYNALASVTADRALRDAERATRELLAGRDRGPLHGIPYGAKDLLAARGAPTTWGAEPFAAQRFDRDAAVVQRLARAGAILVGKLAMVALAGGGNYRYPSASLQGPGKTPWDPTRWSGGSSSGSGAAVAARLVPFALGSETSGSILTPAAYCGVTGLRPTYGLVSRRGAMPLAWTLDKIGPMARGAEDCGLVLDAIAGSDRRDPTTVARPRHRPADDRPLADLRVGYAAEDFEEHAQPAIRAALAEALGVLRELTPRLVPTSLPPHLPYGAVVSLVVAAEGSTVFAELADDGRLDQLSDERQKAGLRAGLNVTARDYLEAMRLRTLIKVAFQQLFSQVDLLLAPARTTVATPLDQPLDAARSAPPPERPGNTALIPAGNAAGLPAIGFPCGFSDEGLPVGLQLVGPPFSERLLVRVAAAYQQQTGWHLRRPPGI